MRLALALLCTVPLVAGAAPRWDFHLRLDGEIAHLRACSPVAQDRVRFHAEAGAARYRLAATRSSGGPLAEDGDALLASGWAAHECLDTRVDLGAAARAERGRFGYLGSEYLVQAPQRWLWRPMRVDPASTIAFELPEGWSVSAPWEPIGARIHRLGPTDADWPALVAFGRFEEKPLRFGRGVLRVALLPPWGAKDLARIEPVAQALASAYGALPRDDAQILVVPIPGSKEPAPWGEATRGGGSAIHLFVGADAPRDALIQDWTATHEFSHLLHPYFGARGRWLGEGLASYYQNVLRARVGVLTAQEAWDKIQFGFERGRRETASQGMTLEDASRRMGRMRSFMRNYWSGAAYWMESDLALRQAGSSLDAALRDYAACCYGDDPAQSPEDFIAGLDRIAPAARFVERYRRYIALTAFPAVAIPRGETAARIMQPR